MSKFSARFLAVGIILSFSNISASQAEPITSILVEVHEGALQEGWFRPSLLGINVAREKSVNNQNIADQYLCTEFGNGDCGFGANKQFGYFGTVVYPPCSTEISGPCIEGLELRGPNSNWNSAAFIRNVIAPTRNAEPQIGFPSAGSMSLWKSKENIHMGGTGDYAIYVVADGSAAAGSNWIYSSLQARIIPFEETAGKFSEATIGSSKSLTIGGVDYGMRISYPTFREPGSVWSDRFGKGMKTEWDRQVEVRLTLRVPASFNGWIGGRLSGVDFNLSKYSQNLNRLVISGTPIAVSEVKLNIPVKNIPSKLKEVYPIEDPPKIAGYFSSGSKHKVAMRVIEALRDFTKDRATQTQTFWGFESIVSSDNRCLNDSSRVVGFVSTNSLAYTNSAPVFEAGKLKYAVGGMHFDEKGQVIKGQYDLVLRSDVARCLYGFTNAPVEAAISITYGDKEENIETTFVNEKNGWLFLSAKNFTFSTPTIEILISQPVTKPTSGTTISSSPTPTPVATPTPSPSPIESVTSTPTASPSPSPTKSSTVLATKKITITCTKGKVVKRITAVNPKCPTGYKKK